MSIRVEEELLDWAHTYARQNGMSLTDLVRELLRQERSAHLRELAAEVQL